MRRWCFLLGVSGEAGENGVAMIGCGVRIKVMAQLDSSGQCGCSEGYAG